MTDLASIALDAETKVSERPHKPELRLWLRMLTCTNLVEALVRTRLRAEFGATLPRFDLMAQLERSPEGMTLGQLSRRMMVSNGNVTGPRRAAGGDGAGGAPGGPGGSGGPPRCG